jgi:hypothetical protein
MEQSKPKEFEQGRADAARDINAGKPRLFWGTRGAWGTFFEDLFRSRYGVLVEHTDCFVWPGLKEHREGYNSKVTAHIDSVFGAGTFDKARAEVESFRRESYAEENRRNDDENAA